MSIELFLAPAASGKTEFVLNLARQAAAKGQEVRIVVATKLQARAWRRRLAQRGGALGVRIFTFDGLSQACLDATGTIITEPPHAVLAHLLRRVVASLPLTYYAPIQHKPGFINEVGSLIALFKGQRIFPAELQDALLKMGAEPRLVELAHIYAGYQDALRANNWADRAGQQWLAAEVTAGADTAAFTGWPLLIVDGFDDFTPAQLELLHQLGNRVGRLVMTLTRAAQIDFPRYMRTQRLLERRLGIAGLPLPSQSPRRDCPTVLQHLTDQLFVRKARRSSSQQTTVALLEATDRGAEVRAALRWLKQQVIENGYEPHQVALMARDVTPYRDHILQIAAEFGLPIHQTNGRPLRQSPVISALLNLLAARLPAADTGGAQLRRRQVVNAWRSPYFRWHSSQGVIDERAARRLDILARQQQVIAGLAQWRAAFAAQAHATDERAAAADEDQPAAESISATEATVLRAMFADFLARSEPPSGARSIASYVAWLERLVGLDPNPQDPFASQPGEDSLHTAVLARANPQTEAADIAALGALKQILRGLVWPDQSTPSPATPVTFTEFFHELASAIATETYDTSIGTDESRILVGSVQDLRGLGFKATAVLGLSEGTFPAAIKEEAFLRDDDRSALSSLLDQPIQPSTVSVERELFYETVARPSTQLLLCRPMQADNGAEWVASPFWREVQRLVAVEPQQVQRGAPVAPNRAASWPEWWEAGAALPVLPAPDGDIDRHPALVQMAAIWAARRQATPGPYQGDLSGAAGTLSTIYGPQHTWSVSRLERYQTCGFLFFISNALGLEARSEPAEGLDSRQLGSIYHAVLECACTTIPREALIGAEAALRPLVAAAAAEVLEEAPRVYGFRATPWWGQTQNEIVENVTATILELANSDFAFAEGEIWFDDSRHSRPTLRDGDDQLRLYGVIDRVDRSPDGRLRIIDYKLGGSSRYHHGALRDGRLLQLPLYALAAREALDLGDIAEGFYWHILPGNRSRFTLSGGDGLTANIDIAVAHAWQAVHRIRSGEFAPRVPQEGCPNYCPAAAFCAHYAPGFG